MSLVGDEVVELKFRTPSKKEIDFVGRVYAIEYSRPSPGNAGIGLKFCSLYLKALPNKRGQRPSSLSPRAWQLVFVRVCPSQSNRWLSRLLQSLLHRDFIIYVHALYIFCLYCLLI